MFLVGCRWIPGTLDLVFTHFVTFLWPPSPIALVSQLHVSVCAPLAGQC